MIFNNTAILRFSEGMHLVRPVEVEDVCNVGVPLGPNQCLSAHFINQAESLEGADPSCDRLLVNSRDDLLELNLERKP